MTPRLGGADPVLDRELAKAPLPRIPTGLANRIVTEVTRLPQEQTRQPAPIAPPPAERKFAAYAAVLVLAVGLAGTVLLSLGGNNESAPLLADGTAASSTVPTAPLSQPSSPILATAEVSTPVSTPAIASEELGQMQKAEVESRPPTHVIAPSLAQQASPDRAAPSSAPQTVQPRVVPEKPAMLAQGAQVPGAEAQDVGPIDQPSSPAAVYGPPAPTQGLGIAGGTLGQISTQGAPRSESARSGPAPAPGAPPRGGPPPHP